MAQGISTLSEPRPHRRLAAL